MFGATTGGQASNEPAKLEVEIQPPPPPSKPNRKGTFSYRSSSSPIVLFNIRYSSSQTTTIRSSKQRN